MVLGVPLLVVLTSAVACTAPLGALLNPGKRLPTGQLSCREEGSARGARLWQRLHSWYKLPVCASWRVPLPLCPESLVSSHLVVPLLGCAM